MDNQNQALKIVEQGFHMTLGAISVATETLQDEQQRSRLVAEIQEELNQRAQEWEQKGETTAQEAREFVEQFINQGGDTSSQGETTPTSSNNSSATQTTSTGNDVPSRLQDLTNEVATLREEMTQFRESS
ncbi:hypothetical protein FRE64_09120 [Euhalothece natronophila Z-M001]|uniref:Uncharacterized protein n=1 Tax=Euhalothece natronophila Z-M001 TaxID=522448 RepID=A0A5B8NM61_9CHRO|nr:hypothetical protein [Euhalothece natronophila]QDZ40088.1 hypothetical protein FRE64_09120 [Euhalothece natronophila Z-M001]